MIRIRPARDEDSAAVVDLIESVFAEYEGCVMDLDGVDADLKTPGSSLDRFWVLESTEMGGHIVGTGACSFFSDHVELKKMYIDTRFRGQGHGRVLVEMVEAAARERGTPRIELWSDTRFVGAHRMYQHLGYLKSDGTRELHDPSNTVEFHFAKDLS